MSPPDAVNLDISFSEQADKGIRNAVKELSNSIGKDNIEGYIIDLRNNPGGLLDQSAKVTNNFLKSGEIVSIKGRDKNCLLYTSPSPRDRG